MFLLGWSSCIRPPEATSGPELRREGGRSRAPVGITVSIAVAEALDHPVSEGCRCRQRGRAFSLGGIRLSPSVPALPFVCSCSCVFVFTAAAEKVQAQAAFAQPGPRQSLRPRLSVSAVCSGMVWRDIISSCHHHSVWCGVVWWCTAEFVPSLPSPSIPLFSLQYWSRDQVIAAMYHRHVPRNPCWPTPPYVAVLGRGHNSKHENAKAVVSCSLMSCDVMLCHVGSCQVM